MSASTVQHNVGVNVSVSPVRDVQVRGVWSVAELVRYKLHLDLVIDIVDIVDIVDISRYCRYTTWRPSAPV